MQLSQTIESEEPKAADALHQLTSVSDGVHTSESRGPEGPAPGENRTHTEVTQVGTSSPDLSECVKRAQDMSQVGNIFEWMLTKMLLLGGSSYFLSIISPRLVSI